MEAPILATKLYIPPQRPGMVSRPQLVRRLNENLDKGFKQTLISAPAGFGKTTMVAEWIATCGRPIAWLSLDEGDNDPARFITYLVKALQTIQPGIGVELLAALQSPQPLQMEIIITTLINEISTVDENFLLILDDYHATDSQAVDHTLAFLIEHQPPKMHLVIATREDPSLPLARLRARSQLTELRAADLRFTTDEAAEFLNQVMGLNLSAEDIANLETRTEGWIAGLQLAAISMQGITDTASFIQSFTGSHRFVLDYLIEEVLQHQPIEMQTFLLRTSVLERLCGPLCDAVLQTPPGCGDASLQATERANLFIVPLDNERRWYRYHHLFRDLMQKRLGQNLSAGSITELHTHASEWYENNELMLEAFRHAAAANDIERAVCLMESKKMPLHQRGVATTILAWLDSLPKSLLDARPSLWWKKAALLLVIGEPKGVEQILQETEAALDAAEISGVEMNDAARDLIGKIAAARANLAQTQPETEPIFIYARRALEYLDPNNLSDRSIATRAIGFAYYIDRDLIEAGRFYEEALSLAQAAGDPINSTLASIRLGQIQEEKCQLHQAADTYKQVMQLVNDYSPSNASVAYLGLARIFYEWNDLITAEQYAEQSYRLARQYDQVIDRLILSEMFLARIKLAQGDAPGAAQILEEVEQTAFQKHYTYREPFIAFDRAFIFLRQGNTDAALQLTQQYNLPVMQARVLIAQEKPEDTLVLLDPIHQEAVENGWSDKVLRVMVVKSMAFYANGEKSKALEQIAETLALAEPEGFIRLFVDEGPLMAELLSVAAEEGIQQEYIKKLLDGFEAEPNKVFISPPGLPHKPGVSPLIDPLSPRELEVLRLIAEGLSNRQIGERLFLALDTVKGHNRIIFDKLQVQSRTEAIARARELGLI